MKRNLLYALTAATMLVGCAKNDVVDSEINKDGNLIGFSTYKNISRGNPVDNNTEFSTDGNNFGVTAFISGESESPYMGTTTQGIEIVSNGTTWEYKNSADQAYWPTGEETLDFYAYAPYTNDAITSTAFDKTNGLTIAYSVPATEANQVDLMYAEAKGKKKSDVGTDNRLSMIFKHALTQLHFKIGTSTTNLKVDVEANGIQIIGLKNSGSFNTNSNEWSSLNGNANYTVTSTAVDGVGYYQSSAGYTSVGNNDQALMLLPQEFAAWDAETPTGVYLEISCKIYQELADETKVYLHGSETDYANIKVGISSKGIVEGEAAEVWKRNNKVTYNLLIGAQGGVLTPIEFATEVEEWLPADGGEIENEQPAQ